MPFNQRNMNYFNFNTNMSDAKWLFRFTILFIITGYIGQAWSFLAENDNDKNFAFGYFHSGQVWNITERFIFWGLVGIIFGGVILIFYVGLGALARAIVCGIFCCGFCRNKSEDQENLV